MKYKHIIFTNDFHSNLPEGATFIEKIYKEKKGGALLVDNGDFSEGSGFYEYSNGLVERKMMSMIFDALIPGNHGFKDIKQLGAMGINNHILNCNVYKKDKPLFKKIKIFTVNNRKVGIIGVMSKDAFLSIPRKYRINLQIKDPVQSIKSTISKNKNLFDLLILCSHSGVDYDKTNFSDINEIDLILSSHCHTAGTRFDKLQKLIRKASEKGKSIGRIEIHDKQLFIKIENIEPIKNIFSLDKLIPFNIYINNYSKSLNKKIYLLNSKQIRLIHNRVRLLNRFITSVNSDKKKNYVLNYTFIRQKNVGNALYQKDINDLLPFNTKVLTIEDNVESFLAYLKNIPKEIKQMSLIKKKDLLGSRISFLTTDYLYDNFYKKKSEIIKKQINLRDHFVSLIKQI